MIKEIVTDREELSRPCLPANPRNAEEIITDLFHTANRLRNLHEKDPENNMGLAGLAANQIGHCFRVFVIVDKHGELIPIVNPVITYRGKGKESAEESCFSFPGLQTTKSRFKKVMIKSDFFMDQEYWKPQNKSGIWTFRHFLARVVQHEMDHLDGILI
jgi:peptide deformylase